ncbi:hypothetical protein [Streptomyces sp. NBC_01435]|uniref:hypothetical protein n=1 Tax=Streptomyces sp. NBC_01435 TaxID=2903865 RepID=UPI002E32501A|nr:hypothetical protein [Streptomyces sp. NBC_01435]
MSVCRYQATGTVVMTTARGTSHHINSRCRVTTSDQPSRRGGGVLVQFELLERDHFPGGAVR